MSFLQNILNMGRQNSGQISSAQMNDGELKLKAKFE